MSLNLHDIVRSAITSVYEDEICYLVQSAGQQNVDGKLIETYDAPVSISAQIQTLGGDGLLATNETIHDSHDRKFYIYSDDGSRCPVNADRLNQRGSDFIYRPSNQSWYKIYNIAEDFAPAGWVLVYGALQIQVPAELSEYGSGVVGVGIVGIANVDNPRTGAARVNSALAGDEAYTVGLQVGLARTGKAKL